MKVFERSEAKRGGLIWPLLGFAAALGTGALLAIARRNDAMPAPAGRTQPDDLTQINGIGPALAAKLKDQGVTRFDQIARWSAADVTRMDAQLRFSGRIERDDWIGQAKALSAG